MTDFRNEGAFEKWFIAGLNKIGHASHVDSTLAANGFPDVNFISRSGIEFWFECKFWKGNTKPDIRPTQLVWFRNRNRIYQNAWIVSYDQNSGSLAVIPGVKIKDLKTNASVVYWHSLSAAVYFDDMSEFSSFRFIKEMQRIQEWQNHTKAS